MLDTGKFLWNAGIFLFCVRDMIAAFETHAPKMVDTVRAAVEQGETDLGFFGSRLNLG